MTKTHRIYVIPKNESFHLYFYHLLLLFRLVCCCCAAFGVCLHCELWMLLGWTCLRLVEPESESWSSAEGSLPVIARSLLMIFKYWLERCQSFSKGWSPELWSSWLGIHLINPAQHVLRTSISCWIVCRKKDRLEPCVWISWRLSIVSYANLWDFVIWTWSRSNPTSTTANRESWWDFLDQNRLLPSLEYHM